MQSEFEEDYVLCQAAESLGLEVMRSRPVVISDRKAIEAAGLMRKSPDYPQIKALLNAGKPVEGASLGPVEYVMRHPTLSEADADAIIESQRRER